MRKPFSVLPSGVLPSPLAPLPKSLRASEPQWERATLLLAALVLCATPALARPGRKRASQPAPLAFKTEAEHIALVKKGKLPGYFAKDDLSKPPTLSAPSALLMEYDTGEVLYASGADIKRYPASTTKILTALLFIENTQPEDTVTCNDPAIAKIEPSSLNIKPGERFQAEQLLYGFLLRSGNDGGVVIAQHVAGSVPAFALRMNERAAQLGAVSSHFMNPHGLHDPEHYTTVRDLALIARGALQNPRFAEAVATPVRTISRSINVKDLVVASKAKKNFYDPVPGADGVKTGFTNPARHCFVGSVTRNGRRLLAVVLHAPSNAIGDTIPLIEWGFARFTAKTVAVGGQRSGWIPTRMATEDRVAAIAGQTVHVTLDRLHPETITTELQPTHNLAPIAAGQEVGILIVRRAGKQVVRIPLTARRAISRAVLPAAGRSPWLWAGLAGCGGTVLFALRQRQLARARRARRRRRRTATAAPDDPSPPRKLSS